MTITEFAIKRPIFIVVIYLTLGVLGIFGFSQLKYDLMPKMSPPVVTITTIYPGGGPFDVETSITKIIEDAVTGLDKISTLTSRSSEGRSYVVIEFDMDVNVDQAIQDAQRKVNEISDRLPITAKRPIISKFAFDEIPVIRAAARSNLPTKVFYQFLKDNVQPRLATIEGVGMITLTGGEEREIKVNIDFQKLKSYGLSLFGVTQTIKASNLEFPTGNVKNSNSQFTVRIAGKYKSIEELRELIVGKSKQGGDIKLSDIAEIQDGVIEITNMSRLNGVPSVGLVVLKTSDANTVDVCKNVRKELTIMETDYAGNDIKFDIAADASDFIMKSANAVKEDLGLAILLVAFVMLIFLHNLRNSLIVMVAIPTSLISAFFMMYIFGFTLNMMTLLAMSLVIGILVDDSIVVLENIYRHLEMGQKQREAALKGRNEIGFAALSITLVDVVVFLPLSLIVGIIGNFLREYALVIVFTTLMSLSVSFTITPMLASRFTKLQNLLSNSLMGRFGLWFENFFKKFTGMYRRILIWSLSNGGKIVIISILLFITSFILLGMGFIGNEFMPDVDRGELIVTIELEPGASLLKTNEVVNEIEKNVLTKFPEIDKALVNVGATSQGFVGVYTNNNAELDITFVDKKYRSKATDVIALEIKQAIQKIPGVKVRVNPIGLMGASTQTPISLVVKGPKYDDVRKAANIVLELIKSIKGTSDVRLSSEEGKPELRVDVDRKKMAAFGLSINDVGQNLKIAFTGDDDSKYREDVNEYSIRIQLDQFDRADPVTVGNFTFVNNKGQLVELKQFADIYQSTGPTQLERQDRMSAIMVLSQVFGKSSGAVATEINEKLKTTKLPEGVFTVTAGQQKYYVQAMLSLVLALLGGILFVYLIMVALYNSYLYPFVVLFSIPLALIGALWGLALTSKSISIYSMLGIIMLVGLVTKNAILLVDRTNQMKLERKLTTFEALLEAGQTRLRPILMTTFSMIFGMMPIALSTASGSEAKSALAVVLIGGLASSMFLTLVLVPVVYQKMDKWKISVPAFIRRLFKIKPKVDSELVDGVQVESEEILAK
ncbi:MAG: efflux RND transporter permease subunit [FCB group bacterium]|jgi:HAE1 family hydrophobic/amphiphilic exporter-1